MGSIAWNQVSLKTTSVEDKKKLVVREYLIWTVCLDILVISKV
jgi:hypothetical protein